MARNTKDTPVLMRVRRCTSLGRVVACARVKFILCIVVVVFVVATHSAQREECVIFRCRQATPKSVSCFQPVEIEF